MNSNDVRRQASRTESENTDSLNLSTIYNMIQQTQQQNQTIINMLTNVQEDIEKLRSQQQVFETQVKRRLTNITTNINLQSLGINKTNIIERTDHERESPNIYADHSRSNNFYSENSLIPEVVHEMSSTAVSIKNPLECDEYDADVNVESLNGFMTPDEKFGSLGRLPIATTEDYHRFEKKLSEPEFFDAMVKILVNIIFKINF